MRTLTRAGVVAVASSAALLLAPVAHATNGDNGDVKTHSSTTDEFDQRDEPKVCSFYLDAFHFDGLQRVDWRIEAWADNEVDKGVTVGTGSITLDADGHGRTQDLSLADGQYKLFWNFDGEKGAAKHKVFKVDCGQEGGGGSSASPSGSASASASASPSASASSSPSPGSSAPASVEPSGSTGATPSSAATAQGGGGDLAETGNGVPVGVLAAVSAALLGAGGYLVVRRRRA
ncbi:LPXTG cell wall anchor domain-containing protein [Streptomyces sp. NPDC017936]|uniref:LPXTG cell wall anchor domain-containing protein n=1 Tax=Streptomyces sp. NPDC017936 TaxID=3365016 RepID=UPI00378B51E4